MCVATRRAAYIYAYNTWYTATRNPNYHERGTTRPAPPAPVPARHYPHANADVSRAVSHIARGQRTRSQTSGGPCAADMHEEQVRILWGGDVRQRRQLHSVRHSYSPFRPRIEAASRDIFTAMIPPLAWLLPRLGTCSKHHSRGYPGRTGSLAHRCRQGTDISERPALARRPAKHGAAHA